MSRCYLRPTGFITAAGLDPDAPCPLERLAGRRDLQFAFLEFIERARPARRRLVEVWGPRGFNNQDWHHPPFDGERLWRDYDRIRAGRPPLAGLSLDRPRIMGIVNVTPDSFSDGGSFAAAQAAIQHGLRLVEEGADILDIGGESTRPGAEPVPLDEELRRVLPVLEGLRAKTRAKISVDTRKAEVMRRAAAAGADILNDVSALTYDARALSVAAESGLPVILMHAQGDPRTMNDNPHYDDVALDVFDFLEARIAACEAAGIPRDKLVADPGVGFGKHLPHNVAVLSDLALYHGLGLPILLGASRKKLIGQLSQDEAPKERVPGSLAAALSAIAQGVQIVRVHDVAATKQALCVWEAIRRGAETALI